VKLLFGKCIHSAVLMLMVDARVVINCILGPCSVVGVASKIVGRVDCCYKLSVLQ